MKWAGREIGRILVRGTNWVGDALMTTPALAAVKDNFPEAHLAVLAKKWVAPVYEDHPATDEIIVLDRDGRHRGVGGLMVLGRELRGRKFDMAVLFQNAIQAAVIAWLARIPIRIGFNTDGRGWLLKPAVPLKPEDRRIHETEYYLRMLSGAGFRTPPPGPVQPMFYLSDQTRRQADERLNELGLGKSLVLGVAPGAAYGPAKQWPAVRFADAANLIMAGRPGGVLIFGSAGERRVAREVLDHLKGPGFDLAGATGLTEAAALIKRCHLFLTNDSGLMHVAAAVGTPLVAVFGSTNPVTTAPIGPHVAMVRHAVACSPCLKPTCCQPSHKCMEAVSAEEVAEQGLALMAKQGGMI
jgi:heptosyltransferase-2